MAQIAWRNFDPGSPVHARDNCLIVYDNIGMNDWKNLFVGDDAMFERSLKTINAFHIYPEAEYWIQRELKVKLGWNDSSTTVQHFDMLVKRRFAS